MTLISSGKSIPLDGKRKLSAKEAIQRAKAMACVRSSKRTECSGQIFVGLFFDGTGNNEKLVEPGFKESQRGRNKHSNIVRLWDAYIDSPKEGFFRFYIPGVGTPFKEIGDVSALLTNNAGSGFAYMGADRICWGITSLLNAVHQYATGAPIQTPEEQRTLVAIMSSEMLSPPVMVAESVTRWCALTALEEKIAFAIKGQQRKVQQINVSIFGFSRGAAQARACAHWLHQIFEREDGGFRLAGVPVRIGFMGIFDTVAAVGVGDVTPVTFGHMAWAEKTQNIHPGVEECAHFIALHEQRASFPLESSTGRGNVGYPGMHSDVGGGYEPGEQGKAMRSWGRSPQLSQIPLLDMHFAALKAGVPLLTIEEIHSRPLLSNAYATDEKLAAAYNGWLATNGIAPAEVGAFTRAHTDQYLRWRGSLHSAGLAILTTKRFFKDASGADSRDLAEADKDLGIMLRVWQERKSANATTVGRVTEIAKDVTHLLSFHFGSLKDWGKHPLSESQTKFYALMTAGPLPPAASITLFEDYVHDSRAGFRVISHHEPEWLTGGYARYRHVFSQGVVDHSGFDKANQTVQSVKMAVGATADLFQKLDLFSRQAYAAARRQINSALEQTSEGAIMASHSIEAAAVGMADGVGRQSAQAYQVVVAAANESMRIYNSAQNRVLLKYVEAQKKLSCEMFDRCTKVPVSGPPER